MGVKNLWDVLEPCKKTLPLHHLQNKRVCVDLSCWMVQLHCVNKSYCASRDRVYLRGLFHRLRALMALNCSIIFVSDGSIPGIKLSTYRRRLNSRYEVVQEGVHSQKEASLKRNMGSEFSCIIKEAKLLGSALGIPCLDGVEEGEAQCALLNLESLCDSCFSSDSDIFLFGAKTVYREICLGEGGYVVCYEMDDIKERLGFGRNSLIALALLLGSDYFQGVPGLGQDKACEIIRSTGDNLILKRIASEGLAFVKKPRNAKKKALPLISSKKENPSEGETNTNGISHNNEGLKQILQVIDAYMNPKCHSADSDAVHRVLAEHSFQRTKLHEICYQFFEWPPEKTDEYILPKIAERKLRRFAILQSCSTGLEFNLPLDKIPVKCPISEIIKPRKVQGQECYEVSWKDLDGLETSIVPADLVERACPDKIMEFKERKATKKQKPKQNRPKSRHTKTDQPTSPIVAELSLELQNLVLDTSSVMTTSNAEAAEQEQEKPARHNLLLVDSPAREDSNAWTKRFAVHSSSCSSYSETEVIDLISPCPEARPCSVSRRYQEGNGRREQLATVIELSDSETDETSPADEEHCIKARELRMFLDSIRKDIF